MTENSENYVQQTHFLRYLPACWDYFLIWLGRAALVQPNRQTTQIILLHLLRNRKTN